MKKLLFVLITSLIVISCKESKSEVIAEKNQEVQTNFTSFGDVITSDNVLSQDEMAASYQNLTPGDTLEVKFTAVVNSVCQSKGCWMRVAIGQDQAMVKFKDYGFFQQ